MNVVTDNEIIWSGQVGIMITWHSVMKIHIENTHNILERNMSSRNWQKAISCELSLNRNVHEFKYSFRICLFELIWISWSIISSIWMYKLHCKKIKIYYTINVFYIYFEARNSICKHIHLIFTSSSADVSTFVHSLVFSPAAPAPVVQAAEPWLSCNVVEKHKNR